MKSCVYELNEGTSIMNAESKPAPTAKLFKKEKAARQKAAKAVNSYESAYMRTRWMQKEFESYVPPALVRLRAIDKERLEGSKITLRKFADLTPN